MRIDLTRLSPESYTFLIKPRGLEEKGFKMTTYKMTYRIETPKGTETAERWFSDKKTAASWANEYLRIGYFPVAIEKFTGDNFTAGKPAYFPLLAIKHFFNGGNF